MKITLTSLLVNDQERAHRFYTGVLGFRTKQDLPMGEARWLTVVSPEGSDEVELVLEPTTGHAAAPVWQRALYDAGIPATSFASADIHAEHARLAAADVAFRSGPARQGPVSIAVFDDTCGNLVMLHQVHDEAEAPAAEASAADATVEEAPVARTGMLVRRPAAEVFEAFVDPAITSKFWFTRGSGRLEAGREVHWDWEMYGVGATVMVKSVDPARRIVIEWGDADAPTTAEWVFTPREDGATFVEITERGFRGSAVERAQLAADSAQGFSFVLAGCKALLEHGVLLDLVADRHPDGFHGR